MTKNEKQVLLDGLRKLAADVADLASTLEGIEATSQKQDVPAEESAPAAAEETPAKVYTYEEVRSILAEKSRTGYRAEVKALLAEVIGNG